MTIELVAAAVLVVVPVAFNLAFFELGRVFDYPGILREPAGVILDRFSGEGVALVMRWYALFLCALAMVPVAIVTGLVLVEDARAAAVASIAVGVLAGLVQAVGLARWAFVVPELARRHAEAEGPDAAARRAAVELVFDAFHRLLGVAIGEHLGYLLTGAWTLLVAAGLVASAVVPAWLGLVGLPIGLAFLVGALEFVGPNEKDGWRLAGALVPITYVAWSAWLIAFGVALWL